ncbi:MAG: chromosomal replication initiator protein DnaA [Bryobacteraceae bacterium]
MRRLCLLVMSMDLWERIKGNLATRLRPEAFQNWVAGTTYLALDGDAVIVAVPSEANKKWLEQEYADSIRAAMRDLSVSQSRVVYEVSSNRTLDRQDSQGMGGQPKDLLFGAPPSQLNPKFTFENFVVGSCNQFAHAAAKAVATMPSRSYNPLFIYGGTGMGKTHLMHAIGRSLLDNHAAMNIVYTSSERFTNELINCIKLDRMSLFHQHYRSADVLLIDDIQILANKERTQEEFFFTFNELYDHQKQIVISSDQPPKSTHGLVERLRSRFEWGLMVDVQPPDLETKMAILDKKAESEGIHLPEQVRIFIATKTKSNVRELEGALVKMIAYSSVTGSPITLPMAQQVLKHLVQGSDRKVSMDAVMRAVAEKFSIQVSQLKQKGNAQNVVYPRQVAMFLVKELTTASLPEIGRTFGGKHHTTVMHSIQKIEELRGRDADLNKLIHSVMDSFN